MKHRSVFETDVLVYKFQLSSYPYYFEPFLKARHSVYNYCRSQLGGVPQRFGMICLVMYSQPIFIFI